MNKTENALLIRLYSIFTDIPLPINGANFSKSADISGFVSYGKDMAELKPGLQRALYHIRIGDYTEADTDLELMERYIKLRSAQGWGFIPTHPTIAQIERLLDEERARP